MLKPQVGVTASLDQSVSTLRMVVFPALSSPRKSILTCLGVLNLNRFIENRMNHQLIHIPTQDPLRQEVQICSENLRTGPLQQPQIFVSVHRRGYLLMLATQNNKLRLTIRSIQKPEYCYKVLLNILSAVISAAFIHDYLYLLTQEGQLLRLTLESYQKVCKTELVKSNLPVQRTRPCMILGQKDWTFVRDFRGNLDCINQTQSQSFFTRTSMFLFGENFCNLSNKLFRVNNFIVMTQKQDAKVQFLNVFNRSVSASLTLQATQIIQADFTQFDPYLQQLTGFSMSFAGVLYDGQHVRIVHFIIRIPNSKGVSQPMQLAQFVQSDIQMKVEANIKAILRLNCNQLAIYHDKLFVLQEFGVLIYSLQDLLEPEYVALEQSVEGLKFSKLQSKKGVVLTDGVQLFFFCQNYKLQTYMKVPPALGAQEQLLQDIFSPKRHSQKPMLVSLKCQHSQSLLQTIQQQAQLTLNRQSAQNVHLDSVKVAAKLYYGQLIHFYGVLSTSLERSLLTTLQFQLVSAILFCVRERGIELLERYLLKKRTGLLLQFGQSFMSEKWLQLNRREIRNDIFKGLFNIIKDSNFFIKSDSIPLLHHLADQGLIDRFLVILNSLVSLQVSQVLQRSRAKSSILKTLALGQLSNPLYLKYMQQESRQEETMQFQECLEWSCIYRKIRCDGRGLSLFHKSFKRVGHLFELEIKPSEVKINFNNFETISKGLLGLPANDQLVVQLKSTIQALLDLTQPSIYSKINRKECFFGCLIEMVQRLASDTHSDQRKVLAQFQLPPGSILEKLNVLRLKIFQKFPEDRTQAFSYFKGRGSYCEAAQVSTQQQLRQLVLGKLQQKDYKSLNMIAMQNSIEQIVAEGIISLNSKDFSAKASETKLRLGWTLYDSLVRIKKYDQARKQMKRVLEKEGSDQNGGLQKERLLQSLQDLTAKDAQQWLHVLRGYQR